VSNQGDGTVTVTNPTIETCNTAFMLVGSQGKILVDQGSISDCGYIAYNSGSSPALVSVSNMTASVMTALYTYDNATEQVTFNHNDIQVSQALAYLNNPSSKQTFTNNRIKCIDDGSNSEVCDILRVYFTQGSHMDTFHTINMSGNNIDCQRLTGQVGEGCRGFFFYYNSGSAGNTVHMTMALDGNYWYSRPPEALLFDNMNPDDDGTTTDFSANVKSYISGFTGPNILDGVSGSIATAGSIFNTAPH
jgi:hypothetical protein